MEVNLNSKALKWAFVFCLLLTLTIPALYPSLRLLFFSPFLVIAIYQKPLSTCLWYAFICGLILDLLSSSPRLGIHALNFCLTLAILYPQQRNFFADNLSTLPLMTFFFSTLSTAILATLMYTIEMHNIFSVRWAYTDLMLMSAADAAYAFIAFILPPLFFGKQRRSGKDYFEES
ncbi:MAG: rod shape-determining protein MreD [Parachlamydiaceae bacterium]